ncbi:MAG: hypothetical protein EPN20_12975 [Magnetospirillum sp.]|nr:MAG: hypothetical protein EPN20_12975 [Magnetospirillum sp.]
MPVYLDITTSPPVNAFAGGTCVAIVADTQVSVAILDAWSESELATLGLVRAEVVTPDVDPETQALSGGYTPQQQAGGAWQYVAEVRPLTADELAGRQAAAEQLVRETAQRDLGRSDTTVLRCTEAGVPVPPEWVAYRKALRAIIGGGAGPVPERPAWPAGT